MFLTVLSTNSWASVDDVVINQIDIKASEASDNTHHNKGRIQQLETLVNELLQEINTIKAINIELQDQINTINTVTLSGIQDNLATVENKTACISNTSIQTDEYFEGCNVNIRDGSGLTDSTSSFGNLIVGYNVGWPNLQRTGSHNLILGDGNGYTSFGGIVSGYWNLLEGPNASIIAGYANFARGQYSVAIGGDNNDAKGDHATIVGRLESWAEGISSTIVGGEANNTQGDYSNILGGASNSTQSAYSVVVGGQDFSTSLPFEILP